jgi:putative flippase GtrA
VPEWSSHRTQLFLIALIVSFLAQKFWTFQDHEKTVIPQQFLAFAILGIVNLGADALMIHILVNVLRVWYIWAQVTTSGIIAVWSFFVYRQLIFRTHD